MTGTSKIDRARRNALKGATLVGAFLTISVLHRSVSAAPGGNGNGNGNGGANGNGGNSNGNGNGNAWGNNAGNCFVRGTQVLTRDGYRPIETLEAGDEVAVRFAGFAPIKRMARHTLNNVSGQWDGNRWNRPVKIRRGALGENVPAADLCLTGLHDVYVDGFLVDAGDLVNGDSIVFESADGHDTLDFFGIELDGHDILDVQGAACETLYRAEMERCAPLLAFGGGREKLRSHLRSIASVVMDRRQPLDIIRDRLDERAVDLARAA